MYISNTTEMHLFKCEEEIANRCWVTEAQIEHVLEANMCTDSAGWGGEGGGGHLMSEYMI